MKLIVKVFNADDLPLEVYQAETVLALKQRIAFERQIPVEQQRLMLNGSPLADGKCLCDYNVSDGSRLHLFVKATKGKVAPRNDKARKDHFWTTLEKVLRRHFTEQDRQKLLRQFREDYDGYIDHLSLDDIECLAASMQERKDKCSAKS